MIPAVSPLGVWTIDESHLMVMLRMVADGDTPEKVYAYAYTYSAHDDRHDAALIGAYGITVTL